MRDREKIGIPPEEQEEYILLETKHYYKDNGWQAGERLKRISKWLSGNGCGVRQAYFISVNSKSKYNDGTVWEDHVKPVLGQVEIEFKER